MPVGVFNNDIVLPQDAPIDAGQTVHSQIAIFQNKLGGYEAYIKIRSPKKGSYCGMKSAVAAKHSSGTIVFKNDDLRFSNQCKVSYIYETNKLIFERSEFCDSFCGTLDMFMFESEPLDRICMEADVKEITSRRESYSYDKETENDLCANASETE